MAQGLLPMGLLMCLGMFHFPCICMAMARQASYMRSMHQSIPFRPQSNSMMCPYGIIMTECEGWEAPYHAAKVFPWACWYVWACSICFVGVWQWMDKLPIWGACINQFYSGLRLDWGCALMSWFWQNVMVRKPHIMVWRSTHGLVDVFGHVPFALWVYGNGWTSFLEHE